MSFKSKQSNTKNHNLNNKGVYRPRAAHQPLDTNTNHTPIYDSTRPSDFNDSYPNMINTGAAKRFTSVVYDKNVAEFGKQYELKDGQMPYRTFVELSYADETYKEVIVGGLVVASNGLFATKSSFMGEVLAKVGEFDSSFKIDNDILPAMQSSIIWSKDLPVVPVEVMSTIITFYHLVNKKSRTEAQVNIYYNYNHLTEINGIALQDIPGVKVWTDDIVTYTPKQYNSASLTEVTPDDRKQYYKLFRDNMHPYVETHSHHTMSAFASGTDYANSLNDGLQITIGKLVAGNYTPFAWATVGSHQLDKIDIELAEKLVELPERNFLTTQVIDVPEDWFTQIEKKPVFVRPKPAVKQSESTKLSNANDTANNANTGSDKLSTDKPKLTLWQHIQFLLTGKYTINVKSANKSKNASMTHNKHENAKSGGDEHDKDK